MLLAPLFKESAAPAIRAAFTAHPALEDALWQLLRSGQASWPEVQITPQKFVAFLAQQLPPEAAEPREFAALRAKDLYILCALRLRNRAAQKIFDAEYMPRVRRALLQLGTQESHISDIQQNLYCRLIDRPEVAEERAGYAGRGELVSWLCTCAIREAGLLYKRGQRELALPKTDADMLGIVNQDPESELLHGTLKEVFQSAFQEAVASLTSRERNLLRYHFLSGLNIDEIGAIYKVHRATAARWLAQTQERLIEKVREKFLLRAEVNVDSLPRIRGLIQSQLSVQLKGMLKRTDDPSLK